MNVYYIFSCPAMAKVVLLVAIALIGVTLVAGAPQVQGKIFTLIGGC